MTLIGATTENPYFEVNSALLSRTRVYELDALGAADVRVLLDRAVARGECGPRGRVDDGGARVPGRALRRRRAHRAERARARLRGRRRPARRSRWPQRRGRAAAPRAPVRPPGRPPLRHDLGLDQGDARLGPRRLAVLPGGDARGRRGSALHRAADGDPRLRGHRQRRSAGAGRWRPPPPPRSSTSGCPSASSRSPRRRSTCRWRRSPTPPSARSFAARGLHPRARAPPAAGAPALLDAQRRRLRQPASPAGPHLAAGADARSTRSAQRFYEPDDAEAALRARLDEIRRARGRS